MGNMTATTPHVGPKNPGDPGVPTQSGREHPIVEGVPPKLFARRSEAPVHAVPLSIQRFSCDLRLAIAVARTGASGPKTNHAEPPGRGEPWRSDTVQFQKDSRRSDPETESCGGGFGAGRCRGDSAEWPTALR